MKTVTTLSSIPILLATLASANPGAVACDHIRVDKRSYDFSKLDAPHNVWVVDEDSPPAVYNTTWTINICSQLELDKEHKDEQCKKGTNICGVRRSWNPNDDPDKEHVAIENVIALAGQWADSTHSFDHSWTTLEATDDHPGGLEFMVKGGTYGKRNQRAFIDFQCSARPPDDKGKKEQKRDGENTPKVSDGNLQFISYGPEFEKKTEYDTLRLRWKTQYACADYADSHGSSSSSWGFFTWLFLVLFIGTAAYLIFGSWLNYNRYGARGWDLLPHGDTIRDIPYLVKDWGKKVVDTVSGPGTRGGYSAV